MSKKKKSHRLRIDFRKNHDSRARRNNLTRDFQDNEEAIADVDQTERVSGKGKLTRKKTVITEVSPDSSDVDQFELGVQENRCLNGRVIQIFGLASIVRSECGIDYRCTIRGILKSVASDQQHVIVVGDWVTIAPTALTVPNIPTVPADESSELNSPESEKNDSVATAKSSEPTAVILRVRHRSNEISRTSRQRKQIIAANLDQAIIVASAAEPGLKPNLIDRFLVSCLRSQIQPIIVINKIDLVSSAELQPLIGTWSQLGHPVLLCSTFTGVGLDRLRRILTNQASVVTGQSGVGKSSLLNAIQPGLHLRVGDVSDDNQKGKHTTTSARWIPLDFGGSIIDTPGIRQFHLWDIIPEELTGYFRDLRPFENLCRFPNCSHTHEDDCGVKAGVADGKIDLRRYDSYCQMLAGDAFDKKASAD